MKHWKPLALSLCLLSSNAAHANLVGTATETFNPTTNGLDFITVQSSETLKPGFFNLGLFVTYEVNALPYYSPNTEGLANFSDTLFSSDLSIGVGLIPNLDVGFSAPYMLKQTINSSTSELGQFTTNGAFTEYRVNSKYHLWNNDRYGLAVIGSMNFNRILNDPYTGENPGPTFNLELAADTTYHDIKFGLNLGYRFRDPGPPVPGFPVDPLRDDLIFSGAASYWVQALDSRVVVEMFGEVPTQSRGADFGRSPDDLEVMGGVKHSFRDDLAFHAGIGTHIVDGLGAPDWWIYTGINFTFGPVFNKSASGGSTVRVETKDTFQIPSIHFETDSDELTGDYEESLGELVEYLHKMGGFSKLVIEGHTDSLGRAEYNQKLSERRAHTIKEYLVSHFKLDASKITSVGYGASQPIADNGNYQGRQANRRVEMKITP